MNVSQLGAIRRSRGSALRARALVCGRGVGAVILIGFGLAFDHTLERLLIALPGVVLLGVAVRAITRLNRVSVEIVNGQLEIRNDVRTYRVEFDDIERIYVDYATALRALFLSAVYVETRNRTPRIRVQATERTRFSRSGVVGRDLAEDAELIRSAVARAAQGDVHATT